MKIIIYVLAVLLLFALPACVAQSDYNKISDELKATQNQLTAMQEQLSTQQAEFNALKIKYPLRDFQSIDAATDWAQQHKRLVPASKTVDAAYAIAMEIQKEAELDGYRVWVNWDENETHTGGMLMLVTYINGKLYYWAYENSKLYEVSTIVPEKLSNQ